jgi:nitrite reductase/ring-hydroxylating ferredoxin subunit
VISGVHVGAIDESARPEGAVLVSGSGDVSVRAGSVVVATNASIACPLSLPLRQSSHRTYAIAFVVTRGSVPPALYWDTAEPYHYVRVVEGRERSVTDLLLVGGEDHRTGHADDGEQRFERLEVWARERFKGIVAVAARWSGQILEPSDGLAFIGRAPGRGPDVYVVTGDSGHGLTHGTLGGMILADALAGRPNRFASLYDPSRRTLRTVADIVKEGVVSAVPYTDWLRPGDVRRSSEIPPGGGAIVRRGVKLLAVYKDPTGNLHVCSAVCRHLGGIVRWNGAEKSWDCPCHGARYDAFGRVVDGPANADLEPASLDEEPEAPEMGLEWV